MEMDSCVPGFCCNLESIPNCAVLETVQVSYIVAEKGWWELSGGLTFEAGSHSTDRARGKGITFA
eukprot:6343276-Ditylum_brightwellii.AAC.1